MCRRIHPQCAGDHPAPVLQGRGRGRGAGEHHHQTGTAPTYVTCDNGPEFTAEAWIEWCNDARVDTAFIDPGSPWQNGFIESFIAQCRREQHSGEIMDTMAEAKYLAEEWKAIYNHERPHGSVDGMTPKGYSKNWTQEN